MELFYLSCFNLSYDQALKQFGKHNTRIFKDILRARNLRKKAVLQPNCDLFAAGLEIHDPLDPNFFKQLQDEHDYYWQKPSHIHKPKDEDHPLYKPQKCFLFDGTIELADGVDEACAMTKSIPAQAIPDSVYASLPNDFLPDDFEKQVADCIMHGERYEGTMEKLPRRHDPILFWVVQPSLYGSPVDTRNRAILSDLYRKVLLLSALKGKSLFDLRCDRNAPISAYLPASSSGIREPLVFRLQPHMIVHGQKPASPIADAAEVEATKNLKVPHVYPISPLVDLKEEHIYNDSTLLPRQFCSDLHINSVFSTRVQDQKYPWTQLQNAANAVLNAFCAALAEATKKDMGIPGLSTVGVLDKPVTVKSVQLVNGKLDMAIVQLNTLDFNNTKNDIKNMIWLEKAAHLYTPKPFFENMTDVVDLNYDTVKKFLGTPITGVVETLQGISVIMLGRICSSAIVRSKSALQGRTIMTSNPRNIGIPFVIDNDGRVERTYDVFSRLLKERIICVMSPIDDSSAAAIIAQLLFLQSDSAKAPIHMYINCPGGVVSSGLGIYDTMQYISAPVSTWCIGQASSMGSLLLCAGEKGSRTALPNSRIMVHQPSGGAKGTASDILISAEEIRRLRSRLNEIYSHHTGQPVDTIAAMLDRDRYLSALEAKELGLVDKVETHGASMPSA
uniref:ATP-dependent Clp protease proteolytic subunit n=1 Tax=Ditylenchus dipsaci TaxID=166011 RepID=A0A915DJS3_9BILA